MMALGVLFSVTLSGQQRDARVVPIGTGEIAGTVVSADTGPLPIRRAIVRLSGDPLPDPRSTMTDDAGRFSFSRLPAGDYSLVAQKAAYLPAEFGARKPGRAGSRVSLATGEKRAVSMTMFRGAAIGGTLRDSRGVPQSGVSVMAISVKAIGQRVTMPTEGSVTNDRGEFRIYGLPPGEYVIAATPLAGGSGEIGARPAAEVDALIATLTQRRAPIASSSAASTKVPALKDAPPVSYAPIYFPGTPVFQEAERIRLNAGDERPTLSFMVTHVPVVSIEGVVSGNVPSLPAVQLAIVPEVMEMRWSAGAGATITAQPPDDNGLFRYGSVSPGKYQIVARGRATGGAPEPPPPPGARAGGRGVAAVGGTGEMLYAVAEVEVRGQDVKGLSLALQPGGAISGKLIFDSGGTPPPDNLGGIRIGAEVMGASGWMQVAGGARIGNALSQVPPALVRPDGTFQLNGIGPGVYQLTCTLPLALARIWKLRAALVDGRDLLDTNITGPYVQFRDVSLVLSDMRTELGGTLQTGSGQASDYYVIAFSTDRTHWRPGSRRTLSARPATNGRFVFSELPSGEYFIAALTDLDPDEWQSTAFLEQAAAAAIKIRVAEGEKKTQDLRIK